jgi:hypothetical protein
MNRTRTAGRWRWPAACAVLVVAAGVPAVAHLREDDLGSSGSTCHNPAAAQTWAGWVTCQATIVEGTATDVRLGPERGLATVTLRVLRWYKPADGPDVTTVRLRLVGGPEDTGLPRVPKRGTHYLIAVPACTEPFALSHVYSGSEIARVKAQIEDVLDENRGLATETADRC